MDIRKLQRAIVDGLEDVKAQNIVVFNTEALSPLFERVIVASGTSNRQTRALASSVRETVKQRGLQVLRTEGEDNGEWIIVDCGAAVAHIMQPAIRDYYRLEEIWGAKPVRLKAGGAASRAGSASNGGAGLTAAAGAAAQRPTRGVATSGAKPGAASGAKSGAKSGTKSGAKPGAKSGAKPGAKPGAIPGARPARARPAGAKRAGAGAPAGARKGGPTKKAPGRAGAARFQAVVKAGGNATRRAAPRPSAGVPTATGAPGKKAAKKSPARKRAPGGARPTRARRG